MTHRFLTVVLLIACSASAQQGDSSGPIRIDPAFRSLAAATGGHALPITPAELGTPGASQLMVALALYDATILAIDQPQLDGPRRYEFPVDGSVRGLSVIVSGRAQVTLTGPDGLSLQPGHPGVEVVRLSRVTGYMADAPAAGLWKVIVDASEPYLMTVEAKSNLDVVSARFVEVRGRPGHGGLFPIQGNPAAGEPGQLEVNLMEPLQNVSIGLRKPNGEAITQVAITQHAGDGYLADVVIPDEIFRVYVRGTDAAGQTIQRAESSTVSPQRFFVKPLSGSLSMWPGDPVAVKFRLENRGASSSFVAYAVTGDGSLATVTPQHVQLGAGQSTELTVNFQLPFDARPGSFSDLMMTITDEQSGGFNSASQQITVRRE
jgi:hypothetical protein